MHLYVMRLCNELEWMNIMDNKTGFLVVDCDAEYVKCIEARLVLSKICLQIMPNVLLKLQ